MNSLYLGLRPPIRENLIHFPVICIEPIKFDDTKQIAKNVDEADWILFTSQSAIDPLINILDGSLSLLAKKVIFSIGEMTAKSLRKAGIHVDFIPKDETQEGVIALFKTLNLKNKKIFCGRSSLSRPCIKKFLEGAECTFIDQILYHTKIAFDLETRPSLLQIKEVIFTSPSTALGFKQAYQGVELPKNIILTAIGPVTKKKLQELFLDA